MIKYFLGSQNYLVFIASEQRREMITRSEYLYEHKIWKSHPYCKSLREDGVLKEGIFSYLKNSWCIFCIWKGMTWNSSHELEHQHWVAYGANLLEDQMSYYMGLLNTLSRVVLEQGETLNQQELWTSWELAGP